MMILVVVFGKDTGVLLHRAGNFDEKNGNLLRRMKILILLELRFRVQKGNRKSDLEIRIEFFAESFRLCEIGILEILYEFCMNVMLKKMKGEDKEMER